MDILNENIKLKIDLLRTGKLTCEENVKSFLSKFEMKNKDYNIVLEVNKNALTIAKEHDKKLKNGSNIGKLFGLTFGIKSNILCKGMISSCASECLKDFVGTYDSDVVKRIKEEDGIILYVLNNDEFASGSSGETSFFGKTINPVSTKRIPGGSSSGSAAAISADFCDITLGSDTGGSIRNPASHCDIVGIKPSYGRVSRHGLIDLSMSLDQIGPLSKDIYGSALTLSVIAGKSKFDSITADKPVDNYLDYSSVGKTYTIGYIEEFERLITDKRILNIVKDRLKELESLGHKIVKFNVKNIDLAIASYYPIVYTEFYSGTRKFDGLKYGSKIEEHCGNEVLRRILGGKEISKSEYAGSYYKKALKVKEIISEEFNRVFQKADFVLSAVTPVLPHKFGTTLSVEDMYAYDAFTIPANLAGICAGVICRDYIKEDDGNISVGLQVMADKFKEKLMFEGLDILDKLPKKIR